MRFLVALVFLFAGFVGYGAYRQRQARLEQLARVASLQDSLRRADSLQRQADSVRRQAQADSAYTAQLAARRAGVDEYLRTRTERPKPLELEKPATKYVVLKKPVRPKRLP